MNLLSKAFNDFYLPVEAFAEPHMSSRSARLSLWNATMWPRQAGFHGAGGEGSQAIIPFVIVEKGLSGTTFEIPRLPTAVGILGMTKSLVLQSPPVLTI